MNVNRVSEISDPKFAASDIVVYSWFRGSKKSNTPGVIGSSAFIGAIMQFFLGLVSGVGLVLFIGLIFAMLKVSGRAEGDRLYPNYSNARKGGAR